MKAPHACKKITSPLLRPHFCSAKVFKLPVLPTPHPSFPTPTPPTLSFALYSEAKHP